MSWCFIKPIEEFMAVDAAKSIKLLSERFYSSAIDLVFWSYIINYTVGVNMATMMMSVNEGWTDTQRRREEEEWRSLRDAKDKTDWKENLFMYDDRWKDRKVNKIYHKIEKHTER